MKCYDIGQESYRVYSHIIDLFKEEGISLKYSGATGEENEELIAREIYSHFGTHYYKCIDCLSEMKNRPEYNKLVENVDIINIIDIGCNIGTATYAYIDFCLQNSNLERNVNINIIFIEISRIRVNYLKEAFEMYIEELNKKYRKLKITYCIINKSFPIEIREIIERLINAPIMVLLSNFTNWNGERTLAEGINELFNINNKMYLLNIETNTQRYKVKTIMNYIKQYKIYDIYGPQIKSNFKYKNLKCSTWKNDNEYLYKNTYYQTNIKEQDLFIYINNNERMNKAFNKTLNTLYNSLISDELEINYFIQNKTNILDLTRRLLKEELNYFYTNNMEFKILKKNGTYRPLVVESGINEILSTSILISIGICIDMNQDDNISFGNRLEIVEYVPNITKQFMVQYFEKFIYSQKNIKKEKKYKYYCKLDIESYYTNIDHIKLEYIVNNFIYENSWFNQGEWLKSTINSYINRSRSISIRKGIPQGLPLSGVLSNMYLKGYDEWFSKTFKDDKMYRYVDDIIIFSNNEIKEENVKMYTKNLVDDLSLKLNSKKYEFGKVENLEFYELGEQYQLISSITAQILSSIYNLPTNVYKLYELNPNKIIHIIHKDLKSIGIFIPPSWLAKKLRKRKSTFTGIKINWGKMYGKKMLTSREWKETFIKKNIKFIEQLKKVNVNIQGEFNKVYNLIQTGNNNIEIERKFKFIFNKLGTFMNVQLINRTIFEFIKDKPWIANLKKLRAYDMLDEDVVRSINSDYTDYCNLIYIWLVGEFGNKKNIGCISKIFLESLVRLDDDSRLANTIACTSLLKLRITKNDIDINYIKNTLEEIIEGKRNEYIYIRNIIFLINSIDSSYLLNNQRLELLKDINLELYELFNWIKKNQGQNITELIIPMYENYGVYLSEEEPSPLDKSGY